MATSPVVAVKFHFGVVLACACNVVFKGKSALVNYMCSLYIVQYLHVSISYGHFK